LSSNRMQVPFKCPGLLCFGCAFCIGTKNHALMRCIRDEALRSIKTGSQGNMVLTGHCLADSGRINGRASTGLHPRTQRAQLLLAMFG